MTAANTAEPIACLVFDETKAQLLCQEVWTTANLAEISRHLPNFEALSTPAITLDGSQLTQLDSAGAWLLHDIAQQLAQHQISVTWQSFSPEHQALLDLVSSQSTKMEQVPAATRAPGWLYELGRNTVEKGQQSKDFLTFIGETTLTMLYSLYHPRRIQWRSLFNTIDATGYRALPIIALLLFLIGIVLAYQMGEQLKLYGANIYIVDITGLAMLQEFAPLITAIIVAGRSGSAITAQIGTMKINQEVDALLTMGLSPSEWLVLPKVLGLIIALPLLTVWADIFGMLGSMVMAKNTLGLSYHDFLLRFPNVVALSTFLKGLSKAPVFAAIISSVGCFQGFQVSLGADSLGRQTTKSVVQSIFLIIIADAIFSIIYSWDIPS